MKSSKHTITSVHALSLLSQRGESALRVYVESSGGDRGVADVPLGRVGGDVSRSCADYVNSAVTKSLRGKDSADQERTDASLLVLDRPNRNKDGDVSPLPHVLRAVSMASARAGALAQGKRLFEWLALLMGNGNSERLDGRANMPLPIVSVFHGRPSPDTNLDFREFSILPTQHLGSRGVLNIGQTLEHMYRAADALGLLLERKHFGSDLGRFGGYAVPLDSTMQAFDLMLESIREAGLRPGEDLSFGIDLGSSTLFDDRTGEYRFRAEQSFLNREHMIELLITWMETYPISYIQDPLDQDDWKGLADLLVVLDQRKHVIQESPVTVAVEDALSGGTEMIDHAARVGACEAVVIALSHMRTVSEMMHMVQVAKQHRMEVIVSRGSGISCDTFLADIAVAAKADAVKAGTLTSFESIQCYNRLIEIEKELDRRN